MTANRSTNAVQIALCVLVSLALFMLANQAFAMDASPAATGMPGESAMTKMVRFISGPVAYMLSIAGLVALVGMMAFGSDMSGALRGVSIFVIVVGFLAFAIQAVTILFTGAVMTDDVAMLLATAPK